MRNVRCANHKSSRARLSLTTDSIMRKRTSLSLDRRQFLAAALTAALATQATGQTPVPRYTAAVIGHTGRGDYGHSVDQVFTNRSDVRLLALADPVAGG